MPDSPIEIRESVEADMAAHERRKGEVHASRNQVMAADALAQYERERAASPPVPKAAPAAPKPIEKTVKKHDVDGKTYTVSRGPDAPMFRTASEFEAQVLAHAQPRLALLLSKPESGPLGTPSWRAKALAAMYFKVKSLEAKEAKQIDLETYYERAYQLDLSELLESSNQIFGDWRKTSEKPLVVQV